MDEAQEAANATVQAFMRRLADHLALHFPLHASALRIEIKHPRLTDERWHRIAGILASLSSVPGYTLTAEEQLSRAPALSAISVAKAMASSFFGSRRPDDTRRFALLDAAEISETLRPVET